MKGITVDRAYLVFVKVPSLGHKTNIHVNSKVNPPPTQKKRKEKKRIIALVYVLYSSKS